MLTLLRNSYAVEAPGALGRKLDSTYLGCYHNPSWDREFNGPFIEFFGPMTVEVRERHSGRSRQEKHEREFDSETMGCPHASHVAKRSLTQRSTISLVHRCRRASQR